MLGFLSSARSCGAGARSLSQLRSCAHRSSIAFFWLSLSIVTALLNTTIAAAQTWTEQTAPGTGTWRSIALSGDGSKVGLLRFATTIYYSSDYGASWAQAASSGSHNWDYIVSAPDGVHMAASDSSGYIYTSSDSGASWTQRVNSGSRNWQAVTISADGTKLAAVANLGYIYTSTDSGANWTQRASSTTWRKIAGSADGNILYAHTNSGYILSSYDSGVTWVTRTGSGSRTWSYIACSADGSRVAAVSSGGSGAVYTSSDYGVTWTAQSNAGTRDWMSIAMSADGSTLLAGVNSGYLYLSTDYGVNWTQQTSAGSRTWVSVSSSIEGSRFAAANQGAGYVYTYYDSNITQNQGFVLSIGTPIRVGTTFTIFQNNFAPYVYWGDATTCEFSYNGGSSWTTADCSLHGSDITAPASSGSKTLTLRGTDGSSNVSTSNYTFTYSTTNANSWSSQSGSGSRNWQAMAGSADGSMLVAAVYGGAIYTSTNYGVTWTQRFNAGSRNWTSLASSIDATRIAATVTGGYVYISSDSGANWTALTSLGTGDWQSIASSEDGLKLAVVNGDDYIYTSNDGGGTWTQQTGAGSSSWQSIASSADGTVLVAGVLGGYLSTSTNSGATWTQRTGAGSRNWIAVASSASGAKLIAADQSGYLYTSTDSGANWTQQTNSGTRSWRSVSSSADGTRLLAADSSGYLYTSTDSGANWTQQTAAGSRSWYATFISGNGQRLAAGPQGSSIFTDYDLSFTPIAAYPVTTGALYTNNSSQAVVFQNRFRPYVLWGYATTCSYSYDSGGSWHSSDCTLHGSDIPVPASSGSTTLTLSGTDVDGNSSQNSITFQYDSSISGWTKQTSGGSRTWIAVASSSDGTKLAAADDTGYIYTSTDSGVTWTQQTNSGTHSWAGIASSSDGTKLVATDFSGYVYRSTDSGANWTALTDLGTANWYPIVSSADGTKLVVAAYGGSIYTSNDSGANWTQRTISGTHYWQSLAGSTDLTKLVAGDFNAYIYTSTDSGASWTQRTGLGTHGWTGVASSADGTKFAAVANSGDYVYTSSDGGSNWTQRTSSTAQDWRSISTFGSGTTLLAGTNPGYLYRSTDFGATWALQSAPGYQSWYSIAFSADGSKYVAAAISDYLYTFVDTTLPAAPTITSPTTGTETSEYNVALSGTAPANTLVKLYRSYNSGGAVLTDFFYADGTGAWSRINSGLSDGDYTFTVTATNAAGYTSSDSTGVSITVDTTPPNTPTIDSPASGTITNDATPTFGGTADGTTQVVKLYRAGSTLVGTVTPSGTWTVDLSSLSDGTHTITAKAYDSVNNESNAASPVSITIDTAAPSAPVITSPTTGVSTGDNNITVTGTAEANSSVKLYRNFNSGGAVLVATFAADGTGAWSRNQNGLLDGTYAFTATATDAANNTGSASTAVTLTVDTTPPNVPTILAPSSNLVTNNGSQAVSGTAEANSTVTVYDSATSLGSTTANGSGDWSKSLTLTAGDHSITAKATDAQDNISNASSPVTITVDVTAPAATLSSSAPTTVADPFAVNVSFTEVVTGLSSSDFVVTNGAASNVSGSGSNYTVTITPSAVGQVTVSLPANSVSDAAGNGNSVSTTLSRTYGTTAGYTISGVYQVDGHGVPNVVVYLFANDNAENSINTISIYSSNIIARTLTDENGAFTFTAVANGDYQIKTEQSGIYTAIGNTTVEDSDPDPVVVEPGVVDITTSSVYAPWNTFLGMTNVAELSNHDDTALDVAIVARDSTGASIASETITLGAHTKYDVVLNDLIAADNYGIIKFTVAGTAAFRCDVASYRASQDATSGRTMDFAFSVPCQNPSYGSTAGLTNRMFPGVHESDRTVSNWLAVTNLSDASHQFTVTNYSQEGSVLNTEHFTIAPLARFDIDAGNYSDVGLVSVAPDDDTIPYLATINRYDSGTNDSRVFAFGSYNQDGSGATKCFPISNVDGAIGYVEQGNRADSTATISSVIYSSDGSTVSTSSDTFAPHTVMHKDFGSALPNGTSGTVCLTSNVSNALIAFEPTYYFAQGELSTVLLTTSKQPSGPSTQYGSYNRFFSAYNWLRLTNLSSSGVDATVTTDPSQSNAQSSSYFIPAHGRLDVPLHAAPFNAASDSYGAVEVDGAVAGDVVRVISGGSGGVGAGAASAMVGGVVR